MDWNLLRCRRLLCAACALLVSAVFGACVTPSRTGGEAASGQNEALRAELVAMMDRDQDLRKKAVDMNRPAGERQRYVEECGEADRRHTARMKEIIAEHGWPTISMVGEEGALAAFLLVQHADQDPEFQARCLPMLEAGAERGEVKRSALAYLTDRVRVKQNRPQVYGTQYSPKTLPDGSVAMNEDGAIEYELPIVEDIERLDERRAAAGLEPWIEYERHMAELHGRKPAERPRAAEE